MSDFDDEAFLMGDEPDDYEDYERAPRRRRRRLEPHRGSTVLVMGILGLLVCFICGIFAWSWGNEDLRKMRNGVMDDEGRGSTEAGRVLGMISVILAIIGIGIFGLAMCVGALGAGASSSSYGY